MIAYAWTVADPDYVPPVNTTIDNVADWSDMKPNLDKMGAYIDTNGQFLTGVALNAHADSITGVINVYAWQGSPETSITGEVLRTKSYSGASQGSIKFDFDMMLAPGEYYFEIVYEGGGYPWTTLGAKEDKSEYIKATYYHNVEGYSESDVRAAIDLQTSTIQFNSASVSVGADYKVNFKIETSKLDKGASYKVTLTGENGIVLTYDAAASIDGDYSVFTFDKIGPHQMGRIIKAELLVYDVNGEVIGYDLVEYSIKEYCENMLADNASSDELKTMLKDMLNYGAAAQKYVSPAIDDSALVNNGMDTETTTTAPSASAEGFAHTPNGAIGFTTASVRLNNGVEIILKTAGTTNAVTVGSEPLTLTDGVYVHRISLLNLTEQYTYTVDGATLVYSLPIYIARSAANADENTTDLLTQLMEFGVSLNAWKNAA